MNKPVVSARIPHGWNDQISAISTETGQTPSDVVKEAIGQYLGKKLPKASSALTEDSIN